MSILKVKVKGGLSEMTIHLNTHEVLTESLSQSDREQIKKEIDAKFNVKKLEDDIRKIVIKDLKKGGALEKEIENIVSNCIVQAFKQIWIKRGAWSNGIQNKSS